MKIYLASRYSRHEELQRYAHRLKAKGHDVTSRWIWGNHQINDKELSADEAEEKRTLFAVEDWEDIISSQLVLSFSEEPRTTKSRGGRHVELGIALGLSKLCLVVGPRENVFHCLPSVVVVDSFESALRILDHCHRIEDFVKPRAQK